MSAGTDTEAAVAEPPFDFFFSSASPSKNIIDLIWRRSSGGRFFAISSRDCLGVGCTSGFVADSDFPSALIVGCPVWDVESVSLKYQLIVP